MTGRTTQRRHVILLGERYRAQWEWNRGQTSGSIRRMVRWRTKRGNPSEHSDAWGFYEALGDRDRTQMSHVEREVAAICDLRQEVNSGGFDAYFRYWGGNSAPLALDALPRVLDQE